MNAFTIRDLENLSGIKAHTIRIWEQRYSFLRPNRSETNIRYYDANELKKLLNIALLNKFGFKISHIDKMSMEQQRDKILSLSSDEARQERMINQLLHAMVDLNPDAFERVLDDFIDIHGIDRTITGLIFPFLQKIGVLWLTDHVRISHEHMVSNIVRQKIVRGIENAGKTLTSAKSVVLFLPEAEYHEIGLLYVHYLLKVRGLRITYLGADVPVEELEYVCAVSHPDFLYTHLISLPSKFSLEKFFNALNGKMNGTPLVISGRPLSLYGKKIPPNVYFKNSLEDVLTHFTGNGQQNPV